jgi:hypothetical protein
MKAMFLNKLKAAVVVIVVACVLGWGAGVVWQDQVKAQQARPIGGELSFDDVPMPDLSGTWQGDGWGTVVLRPTKKKGAFDGTYTDTFGKDVGRIAVRWSAASRRHEGTWSEGKFRFGRIALEAVKNGEAITGAWTTDPKCEHEPGVPSLASLRWSKKPAAAEDREQLPQKKEKEAFTAWGKEINGMQAGLGFRSGEKRTYRHGEAVKLVLRVRNVGKEAVEFKHIWAFFVENPPTVTDADGKKVQIPRLVAEGLHMPRSPKVAPGKEIEIYDWEFDLQPKGGSNKNLFTIHGTGKFSLQCERIVGSTSCNPNHPNPTLSKLTTGKLELEIQAEPPPAAAPQR